jgi:hypothetical protein
VITQATTVTVAVVATLKPNLAGEDLRRSCTMTAARTRTTISVSGGR